MKILTIGYEKRESDEFIEELKANGVQLLFDVRYRPSSRKKGFSKSHLKDKCQRAGITYFHDRRLGTPPDLMDMVRQHGGYSTDIECKYREYLMCQENSLIEAGKLVSDRIACLLCYERQPDECHRKIVAEELAGRLTLEVFHIL